MSALVVGYVPLTGLDHLHLHIDHGIRSFHEHLHIGHHAHGVRHGDRSGLPAGEDDSRPPDDLDDVSAVFSLGHSAHVRPPAAEVERSAALAVDPTMVPDEPATDGSLHPSWSSRAPPP